MYYDDVTRDFPNVHLHMIKNKNYEYGAWKYIVHLYPNFDVYFCIQDTLLLKRTIPITGDAYTFHHFSGYTYHTSIKPLGQSILSRCRLTPMEDKDLVIKPVRSSVLSFEDKEFNIAQHCSFIVNNSTIKNMFNELIVPPTNKDGSCCYERIFGIYFLVKNIPTINLHKYMIKIHGERD
jgi:hypothetical protein